MKVVYTPQIADFLVVYSFSGETVTATIAGQTDSVEFSALAIGHCRADEIETTLPHDVFRGAARDEDGNLTVWLLNPYPERVLRDDHETNESYDARRAHWQRQQTEYEEII
ncbi:hypothetical protein [Salinicola socius]|uniref:Uncharacterized protein n=1 Tax=Salinicola socius TaxID=404433 RepID=A0A1Q8SV27_9GAMM|nr:hypothetical protein [Salinicola socius]OLO05294.1 hypothetical protein BTW07_04495 [Salinicola socius]